MTIDFAIEPELSAQDFQSVLLASGLAERRPADDLERLNRMLRDADVIVTARAARRLVGVSRAITDFAYCCYLSDLAVDCEYQRQGIGRRLIEETHARAGLETTLILIAAPAAENYYVKVGMTNVARCWTISRLK